MKKYVILLVLMSLSFSSCAIFKRSIMIDGVIKQKILIDDTDNPAQKYMIKKDLKRKRIHLKNVVVKDIISSANIDYDYCVIVDVPSSKGNVECYIFTQNVRRVSKLVKGQSRIDASGEFSRFFTMLDQYYTKVEIVNARIKIRK